MQRFILLGAMCFCHLAQAAPLDKKAIPLTPPSAKTSAFKSFTGRVVANKVRVRCHPDLDSAIVRQLNKQDLVLVVGEEGDFFAIDPLKETKAYIFRSYILDGVIEADRVNVRLQPHLEAPVIGQLKTGDRVEGNICSSDPKWLEITPPKGTHFYIAKELLSCAGGPEYLATTEKRQHQANQILNQAYLAAEEECKKPFEQMQAESVMNQFRSIIQNFSDFPDLVAQAKEGLALLKETYLNKKVDFLEAKSALTEVDKKEMLTQHQKEKQELLAHNATPDPKLWKKRTEKTQEPSSFWDTLEESLYLSWSAFHTDQTLEEFYKEQQANASVVSGTLEVYPFDVKNKPGDYILRGETAPLAYLYSTHVDLEAHLGKQVTLQVAPRPNHHFAFPAYYVLRVE